MFPNPKHIVFQHRCETVFIATCIQLPGSPNLNKCFHFLRKMKYLQKNVVQIATVNEFLRHGNHDNHQLKPSSYFNF